MSESRSAITSNNHVKQRLWQVASDDKDNVEAISSNMNFTITVGKEQLLEEMITYGCLAEYKEELGDNFALFIQKYLASSSKLSPNQRSAAFKQSLEEDLIAYFFPSTANKKNKILTEILPKTGNPHPALLIFDSLLRDYISLQPKGIWSAHVSDYAHFHDMVRCHKKSSSSDNAHQNNLHTTIIEITLELVLRNLYRALHAFRDNEMLISLKNEYTEDEFQLIERVKLTPQQEEAFRISYAGDRHECWADIFKNRAFLDQQKTLLDFMKIRYIQGKTIGLDKEKNKEIWVKDIGDYTRENNRYQKKEDAVEFLKDLRNILKNKDKKKRRLMLGIGFKGSLFDAAIDSHSDVPIIYLCFTEQFRITGSIFLNYVALDLREILSDMYKVRIHTEVPRGPSFFNRLLCHYTMEKIWQAVISDPKNVNSEILKKMQKLVIKDIDQMLKQKTSKKNNLQGQEILAGYMNLTREKMLENLSVVLQHFENGHKIEDLNANNLDVFKKIGEFLLNRKMYVCLEMQLVPLVSSGWIFPVIISPTKEDNKLISFTISCLDLIDQEHSFSVAKPCERFCEPASTAYDLLAEIESEFSQIRKIDIRSDKFSKKEQVVIEKINTCLREHKIKNEDQKSFKNFINSHQKLFLNNINFFRKQASSDSKIKIHVKAKLAKGRKNVFPVLNSQGIKKVTFLSEKYSASVKKSSYPVGSYTKCTKFTSRSTLFHTQKITELNYDAIASKKSYEDARNSYINNQAKMKSSTINPLKYKLIT